MTNTERTIIGTNIKRLLKTRELSVAQLADALGSDRTYINDIVNGHANFTINYLENIAGFFGVKAGDLFKQRMRLPNEEQPVGR